MNRNQCRAPRQPLRWLAALWLALSVSGAEANLKLSISSAAINKKSGDLTVKGSFAVGKGEAMPQDKLLRFFHGRGGMFDTLTLNASKQKFAFTVPAEQLTEKPCEVGVAVAGIQTTKKVAGTPNDCKLIPVCKIVSPAAKKGPVTAQLGQELSFKASAKLTDKSAAGLTYEWDFAGGAMGHPAALDAKATFIRDNSHYRVRFSATDSNGHRCDAFVEVTVGTPPTAPAKVAERPAPKRGSQLVGAKNDVVVLPFENWTFQGVADHDFQPNQQLAFNPPLNSLNAIVYRKDRLPVALDASQADLTYSAASNPADPAGSASINSTSRNWRSNSKSVVDYILDADLQKTDLWDIVDRRGETNLASDYLTRRIAWQQNWAPIAAVDFPMDEGYWADPFKPFNEDNSTNFPAKGADMPGFAAPFTANDPQPFNFYDAENRWHSSGYVPVTDIDDQGRVNPYPLMRVEATDKDSGKSTATTAVMTTSRDHHCRECHAKGKIAANPATQWTEDAFHYSVTGKLAQANQCGEGGNGGGHNHGGQSNAMLCDFTLPRFFDAAGPSIREQEDAAMKNVYSLHDFYDGFNFLPFREIAAGVNEQGQVNNDGSFYCTACHVSPTRHWPLGVTMWGDYFNIDESGAPYGNAGYLPNYTLTMHKFHGRLQRDPGDANKILREASGVPKLWDPSQGANPNTLFPTTNADGSSKPMEDNCLQCHAGQREQQYRDRMFTAGVTCSDCHGDMLAVGMGHEKPQAGADGNQRRVAYYDEPDCGSCHTGNGNEGKNGTGGFFSAGVMKRAFDAGDLSATTRPPKTERFAVQPKDYGDMPAIQWKNDPALPDGGERLDVPVKINERVYRDSKDKHGDVACGACHGPAHGVWPNRDPKANDNMTAVELQGHTGTILECNVCHTADSFKELNDLDGGQYSGDSKTGILGGPHNMHPINDVYWWKEAPGDTSNASGTTKGGWHNNYAKMPGADGEDQCAACHGDDHKGTRLSKTPVDRTFVDENGKPVAVKAGTPIACDLCHSLEKSFTDSPAHGEHSH